MADLRVDIAAEFTGKKAFDKADKATGSLNKSVLRLAKTFGPAVLGAAIVKFGKDAAQAFIEDQKQATRLAVAVKNLGLELSNPSIANYIDNLSKASGVADTQLRPAFQALLTTTGSVTESQKLLQLAIDTSVGSGIELTQVAQDLSNAFVGKTKALSKYNLGLTAAELKTIKFTDVQQKLNDQYKGSNAAFLNTYAGKMQALGVAAGEASELIGGALIDSLMSLSGSATLTDLITQIDDLANKTVGWIDRLTEGVLEVKAIAKASNGMGILGLIINKDQLSQDIQDAQVDAYNKMLRRNQKTAWAGIVTPAQSAAEKKAAADAAKRAKAIADAQAKQTKELKKQTALKKAGTVFDLEQIGIIAALKGKISEDDKIRLQAQLAILNENDVLASSLTKQVLMAQDESGKLYQFFLAIGDAKIKNPFAFLDEWIIEFQKKLDALKFPIFDPSKPISPSNKNPFQDPSTNPFGFPIGAKGGIGSTSISPSISSDLAIQDTFNAVMIDALAGGSFALEAGKEFTQAAILALSSARYEAAAQAYGMGAGSQTIELKVTGDGDLTNAIASSLQQQSLSTGNSTYINRRTGGFE